MIISKKRIKNPYSNKTIILYGAGELGKLASEFFNFYNIKYIVCVDDVNTDKVDPSFDIDNVVNIKDVSTSDNPLILICISTVSFNKLKEKLNDLGFGNVKSFFEVAENINKTNKYKHPLTNGWTHSLDHRKNKKIQKILNEFNRDYKSYYEYLGFFYWHKEYEEWFQYSVNCNNRYFIPEITEVLHDQEVFIDGGAYDGRVTEKFIEITGNQFKEIHMFEPQEILLKSEILTKQILSSLYTYPFILGKKHGYVYFNLKQGYLSKVDKKAKDKVCMIKLDSIKYLKPTIIKYHLEGYELNALKGSVKTIKKYRPILMITTYHTKEGLYKIPLWLIKHCKNYIFYWRNHNYMGQGAVMYAIPKERYK